jgi:pimeloyl-ACP methyl ester carboxylesterase
MEEAVFMASLAAKVGGTLAAVQTADAIPSDRNEGAQFERVPLPWFVKKAFLENFLRDVHHYLFNTRHSPRPGTTYEVQKEIRSRLVAQLAADAANGGPHILVTHSMGTVIGYDCLKRVPECPAVDGLITIGSPLGLDEVQDKLQPGWTRADGFPGGKLNGGWINVFDRLDPVAGFDPLLANDFRSGGKPAIRDVVVQNQGAWRHSMVKYLGQSDLRNALRQMLQLD